MQGGARRNFCGRVFSVGRVHILNCAVRVSPAPESRDEEIWYGNAVVRGPGRPCGRRLPHRRRGGGRRRALCRLCAADGRLAGRGRGRRAGRGFGDGERRRHAGRVRRLPAGRRLRRGRPRAAVRGRGRLRGHARRRQALRLLRGGRGGAKRCGGRRAPCRRVRRSPRFLRGGRPVRAVGGAAVRLPARVGGDRPARLDERAPRRKRGGGAPVAEGARRRALPRAPVRLRALAGDLCRR